MSQPGDTSIFQVQWSRIWREGRDTLRGDHNSSLDDVDFLGISARIYYVFLNVQCLHHQMILLFTKKNKKTGPHSDMTQTLGCLRLNLGGLLLLSKIVLAYLLK